MGTWTSLTNQAPFGAGQMLLLTDGTIMVQQGGSQRWWRLTPDKSATYINGSWSRLANMANNRTFFDTAVLADGRVFVAGGEYSDAGPDTDNIAFSLVPIVGDIKRVVRRCLPPRHGPCAPS